MSWLSDLVGKIPVVGGAINSVAHNVVDPLARSAVGALPGGSALLGIGDTVGKAIPDIGGLSSSAAGGLASLGNAASGATGGINPAVLALAAAQGVNATQLGAKANDYADKGWNAVNDSYTSRAPLRAAGIAGLQANKTPQLANLSAIASRVRPAGQQPLPTLPTAGG